jgi:hypothetical protein
VDGISRLLRLRRQWNPNSTDAYIVLQAYRKLQLALSFGCGKACVPVNTNWADDAEYDKNMIPKEQLRDILMPVPGLLAAAYKTKISSEEQQQVLHALTVFYRRLRNWNSGLNLHLYGSDQNPAPEILMTLGIDVVDLYLLYWSVCLAIYNATEKLRAELPIDNAHASSYDTIILPEEDANVETIFQFARVSLRPEAGIAGVMNVCLPLGIVARYGIVRHRNESRGESDVQIEALLDDVRHGSLGPIVEIPLRRICYRAANS